MTAPPAADPPAPTPYSHTQFGTAIAAGTVIGVTGATVVVLSLSRATLDAAPWLVAALYGVLVGAFAIFYRLKVEVDAEEVRAVFGIGLYRKTIALASVVRTDIVRTRLRWGWGIHWTSAGWLYNVAGRHAVRLELAAERPVMIGTDEPERLKAAIDAWRSVAKA